MNVVHEYVAKPIIVEAIQFDRSNFLEVEKLIGEQATVTLGINYVNIKNSNFFDNQNIKIPSGEWIVKEQHGKFFSLTNSQFIEKYERIDREF